MVEYTIAMVTNSSTNKVESENKQFIFLKFSNTEYICAMLYAILNTKSLKLPDQYNAYLDIAGGKIL